MKRKFYQFDVQGKILGRVAVEIAQVLSGRQKVDFTPNEDKGDWVVVINSDKVRVTGNKEKGKKYYHYSGYPGGLKEVTFRDQLKNDSRKIIEKAVKGMLPKNKLQAKFLKRLLIYKNEQHPHKIDKKIS